MNADAYARMLLRLLPPGALWRLDADGELPKLMNACAQELARVDARASQMVEESDPRTALETLGEWERALSLPDKDILTVPTTVEGRRLAIVQKLVGIGGQRPDYYVLLAAACGYVVDVFDEYGPLVARVGRWRCGDRLYGTAWAYTMRVTVHPPSGPALTHAELERSLRRRAPAHVVLLFVYL